MFCNKKGALELSVNSIVIMVIAFVVLGLILTFTRTIFNFGTERVGGIMDIGALETPPSADSPITLADKLKIKANEKKTMNVGFYNRNSYTATDAKFGVHSCQDEMGAPIDASIMPTITSVSQGVDASDSKGYKLIVNENGLTSGQLYICTIAVYDGTKTLAGADINARGDDAVVYESKQIFLDVTA